MDEFEPHELSMPALEEIAPGFRLVEKVQVFVVEDESGLRWIGAVSRLQEGYGATPVVLAFTPREATRFIRDVAVCLEATLPEEEDFNPELGDPE